MRFFPIFFFFLYIYLEISVFVAVANIIGVLLALICIILTSIIGLSLVKFQGLKNFIAIQQKIANNQNPTNELVRNFSLLLAGLFLLIPGFITDIIGIGLLLPPIQKFFIKYLLPKITIQNYQYQSQNSTIDNGIIEGKFERKNDD